MVMQAALSEVGSLEGDLENEKLVLNGPVVFEWKGKVSPIGVTHLPL